jgi:hypothetical protein
MVRMTRIAGINQALSMCGLGQVANLDDPQRQDALQADTTLDEVLREVAADRRYYNFIEDVDLTPDVDGFITLGSDIYDVELRESEDQVVIRDDKLFNLSENTDVFDAGTYACDITYYLSFTELPEAAKQYIIAKVARKLYTKLFGATPHLSLLVQEERVMLNELNRFEAEAEDHNLLNHRDAMSVWLRPRLGGWRY